MLHPKMRQPDGTYSGIYVDCTFGRGGHSREILKRLSPEGRLIAFDVDREAVNVARRLEAEDPRFQIMHRPFGDLADVFRTGELHGVLLDLGVSSPQLDDRHRGFTDREDGPLDLRMNQMGGIPASDWLHQVTEEELTWVIHSYGEDDDWRLSERLAACILAYQKTVGTIKSTTQLADLIRKVKISDDHGMPPAKLTFQAIRVFLNHEMQQLDQVLQGAFARLVPSARCSVISFKRKESNAIRRFVREHEEPHAKVLELIKDMTRLCEMYPLLTSTNDYSVRQIGEPIKPSLAEVQLNWRSRSSALHVLLREPRTSPRLLELRDLVRDVRERMREPGCQPAFCGAAVGEAPRLLADNSEAMDGAQLPVAEEFPPDVEEAQEIEDFRRVRAIESFSLGSSTAGGYLNIPKDALVYLTYEGTEGDEFDWCFGCLSGSPEDFGWFPKSCVADLELTHVHS